MLDLFLLQDTHIHTYTYHFATKQERSIEMDAQYSSELQDATAREAGLDADRVALFLHEIGLSTEDGRPLRLPAAYLLRLGAALRLLSWESKYPTLGVETGLPTAERAILDAFEGRDDPTPIGSLELPRRVVEVFATRFAWHARRELDAVVMLDDRIDEAALDAVARFLWDRRHARCLPPGFATET